MQHRVGVMREERKLAKVPVCLGGPELRTQVFPLLYLCITRSLSFPPFTSPGGLHHLIWINEEVDLHPSFLLSLALSTFR